MIRAALAVLALALLSACGGPAERVYAPADEVARFAYTHDGPPKVTLFTMQSTSNGVGHHSALMINGPTRIIFNPAGTFQHPRAPEQGDVNHGITPGMLDFFIDFHARETYDVVTQEVTVSPETARQLYDAVMAYGSVPKAQCSLSITRILSQTPGFETVRVGYWPNRAMEGFALVPGVTTRRITDDDADSSQAILVRTWTAAEEAQRVLEAGGN